MRTIQASEAKTHFLRILDDVERGESVMITRRGKTVAKISPETQIDRRRVEQATENILALRKRINAKVSIEQILADRDEGRA